MSSSGRGKTPKRDPSPEEGGQSDMTRALEELQADMRRVYSHLQDRDNQINSLQQALNERDTRITHLENLAAATTSTTAPTVLTPPTDVLARTMKAKYSLPPPAKYDGSRGKLKAFLTQLEVYVQFYIDTLPTIQDQIFAAATLMEGDAADWIQTYVQDYMHNPSIDRSEVTNQIFGSKAGFVKAITEVFGDADEERDAARRIHELRQTKSASEYTAKFRHYMSKLSFDDAALCELYYRGLKDDVKDAMVHEERPTKLHELIAMAVRIDNRQWERKQEKHRRDSFIPRKNDKEKPKVKGEPMEIDAALRAERKEKGLCLNCGKPGHFANKCRKRKDKDSGTDSNNRPKCSNCGKMGHETESCWSKKAQAGQKTIEWKDCTKDACEAHREQKEATGYFPTKTLAMMQQISPKYIQPIFEPIILAPLWDEQSGSEN